MNFYGKVYIPNIHRYFILALLLLTYVSAYAQKASQEVEAFSYNLGFGIVSTSVSALVNKPKDKKTWPCIKEAIWQGALGGALQYAGKKLTYQITRTGNYTWGWGSKILESAGTSICTNAAMNRPFGSYWAMDYAALHLNVLVDNGRVRVIPQFNLLFLFDLYYGLRDGHIDWKASLKTGTFSFESNSDKLWENDEKGYALGGSWTRSIIYLGEHYRTDNTIAHEIIHTYQVDQFRVFNTCFNPLIAKIQNRTLKGIFKYIYIEFPFSYPVYGMFYHPHHYYRNPFEFEAEFLSTNKAVDR